MKRAVFLTEPLLSAAGALAGLRAAPCEIVGVVSKYAKARGRHPLEPWKRWSLERQIGAWGLDVHRADRASIGGVLDDLAPDIVVSCGSGIIVPGVVTERHRIVNLHPSLLPHYGGPAPQLAMLLRGDADRYGGLTLHRMDAGIDTGPIIRQIALPRSNYPSGLAWNLAAAQASYVFTRDLVSGRLGAPAHGPLVSGDGNYISGPETPIAMHSAMTFDEVEHYVAVLKDFVPRLQFDVFDGTRTHRIVVGERVERMGAPTGEVPAVAPSRVELDIADARIRFTRASKPAVMARRVGRAARLLTTPYAAG